MRTLKLMPLLCRPRVAADMTPVAFLHRRQSLSRTASRSNWRSAQFYWPIIGPNYRAGECVTLMMIKAALDPGMSFQRPLARGEIGIVCDALDKLGLA